MAKTGRPTKLTDDVILKICEALEDGWCSIDDACALAGITKATYHNWVNLGEAGDPEYVEFFDLVNEARAKARAQAIGTIKQAAREEVPGQWQAAAWFLERSHRKVWGKNEPVEGALIAGSNATRIIVEYDDSAGVGGPNTEAPKAPQRPGPDPS